jgi:hypothetical protein
MAYHCAEINFRADPAAVAAAVNDSAKLELGRREWHRIRIDLPAVLRSGRASLPGRLVDIGVGGALFEPEHERFRFRGACVVRLPVPTRSAKYTAICAAVVRAAGGRFALFWTQRMPAYLLIALALPLER